jgi:hypothetical protein
MVHQRFQWEMLLQHIPPPERPGWSGIVYNRTDLRPYYWTGIHHLHRAFHRENKTIRSPDGCNGGKLDGLFSMRPSWHRSSNAGQSANGSRQPCFLPRSVQHQPDRPSGLPGKQRGQECPFTAVYYLLAETTSHITGRLPESGWGVTGKLPPGLPEHEFRFDWVDSPDCQSLAVPGSHCAVGLQAVMQSGLRPESFLHYSSASRKLRLVSPRTYIRVFSFDQIPCA